MDSLPSLETVYQAVHTLYHNPDPSEKEKASLWLGELQKSVYAWKVADELLHRHADIESCYFAAQTMRTKIQLSFHELPIEAHSSLRDSLLEHLSKVNENTSSVIVTQLCLALADLGLQMSSWQKPVLDLINRFGPTNVSPLLEIMTVLPEEVNSRALRLGANRRQEVHQELLSCLPSVSDFLKACLTSAGDNSQIQMRVLRCFTSWVSVQAISLPQLAENIVVANAFHILSNRQANAMLHEAAADCVCALLQCLEDNNNQQALELQLFNSVMSLEEGFHMSVAREDQEKTINYCRIFTELAESFLEKIVSSSTPTKPHFAIKILDLVLICVGHHDYEVAAITFNLWYRLSEELYQKNSEHLTALFKPYVGRLIAALCTHCQMEPDHEGLLEEGDDFGDFRLKVSELIKDVVFIVGSSNCFRQMFINLQSIGVTWDASEAALFIMQAVAKNILPEESEVVPKVVEAILNLPTGTHIAVRYTSILLLGELCEWIEKHPQSLEPVLNCLLYCLQQPQLASVAANSLQSICSSCRNHMAVHFNGLVQIIQSLDTFSISNESAIGLLKGVSIILGRMPHEQIHQAMKEICWFQIKPLCLLIESDMKMERGTKTDPVLWLDRLAAIFRHTNPDVENGAVHPCQSVITEIWPVLSSTCERYQSDLRVMERCCRCLKFAVRCVGKQSAHLLEPLVKQMVTLYSQHRHSCFLYLGSILVNEYASEPGCIQGLLEMLQAFITPTFVLLQEDNGLKNHPDTVEDLFRLCSRFLQRAPVPFLTAPALVSILQCALMATSLDHRDANASVMKFFYDLIHCGRNHDDKSDFEVRSRLVKEIVEKHGQTLVNNLIHACVFSLHSYMLSDVADVIMELMISDRECTSRWLEEALKVLPKHNSGGSITATHIQLEEFHRSLIRADNSKGVTHTLRSFSRLYR
ncbi:transportin 3 isoform X1 [Lycorma delicatula]|uniref:transportin 3 isoform X1 n=1 Tax=Lycorma delicatula TaxID=130591 RepID=UPI003F514E36